MELINGVYEVLINKAISNKLSGFDSAEKIIAKENIDSSYSNEWFANYLANTVSIILNEKFKNEESEKTISEQVECINKILKYIEKEWKCNLQDDLIEDTNEFLRGIYDKVGYTEDQVKAKSKVHPMSGYRVSSLFTGSGKEVSVGSEICLDIKTADRIDLLVSFIKFRGWRLIADELKEFVNRKGTQLRILTTTYMGATDERAIQELYNLKQNGNVEIKVSYNGDQDRLHAKVYSFYRNSGSNTAYIGSSNLSKEAITTGMEWNIRITQAENPHIIEKMKATFEQYWTGQEFEAIETEDDVKRFKEAISRIKHKGETHTNDDINAPEYVSRFIRKNHQIRVLEQIRFEREHGSYKNLIVAATGTGKTAISAFDFKDFKKEFKKKNEREPRLLFIVHREKILKQARFTFRSVLVDGNFGQLWVGNNKPSRDSNLENIFVSIQTFNSNIETFKKLGKSYYDYIVIDEAHHSQADSYRILFSLFEPKILIGLTATPERMDGRSLLPDFNDRIAAEIRLPEALEQGLLCPFDYYCVTDDSVDLSKVVCKGDKYDPSELNAIYENNKLQRFAIIQKALYNYINDPHDCKAVCFCCSIQQAESMNEMFRKAGYNSMAVTSNTRTESDDIVEDASGKLARGEVNYLFVADMLNEGVDIPEIDTILFLRPTESLTIFIQQLGRGLRLADNKNSLTVLDFIAQAHASYNYESRFRALIGKSNKTTTENIQNRFPFLPPGCTIKMESVAQEYILKNIQNAIFGKRRLIREVSSFSHNYDQDLTLPNFLNQFSLDWRLIYKTIGSWTELKRQAGIQVPGYERTKEIENIEKGLTRLYHVNSYDFLSFINNLVKNKFEYDVTVKKNVKFAELFYYDVLFSPIEDYNKKYGTSFSSIVEGIKHLNKFKYFMEELEVLVDLKLASLHQTTSWIEGIGDTGIELYGCYSADEIHLLCENKLKRGIPLGTQYIEDSKLSLVLVTTNKADKDYSPSTLYKDYAINSKQFHWQSKNDIRIESKDGQRFINQKDNGWRFLLFVRENKKDKYGFSNCYYCLGLMDYEKSEGECPMNITWKMKNSIPGFILERAQVI